MMTTTKKPRLGRGLDALLGAYDSGQAKDELKHLPIDVPFHDLSEAHQQFVIDGESFRKRMAPTSAASLKTGRKVTA